MFDHYESDATLYHVGTLMSAHQFPQGTRVWIIGQMQYLARLAADREGAASVSLTVEIPPGRDLYAATYRVTISYGTRAVHIERSSPQKALADAFDTLTRDDTRPD